MANETNPKISFGELLRRTQERERTERIQRCARVTELAWWTLASLIGTVLAGLLLLLLGDVLGLVKNLHGWALIVVGGAAFGLLIALGLGLLGGSDIDPEALWKVGLQRGWFDPDDPGRPQG
jgi:MFS family permease